MDKNGTGKIGAAEAALFLKKSGCKETLLHKIWELSDPLGRGFLDKQVSLDYCFQNIPFHILPPKKKTTQFAL